MLRHIYFLSLLLCINITFCYDYLPNEETNLSQDKKLYADRRKSRRRVISRNQDYDTMYDTKSKAQIDLANFIQHPDEFAVSNKNYDPYSKRYKVSEYFNDRSYNNQEVNKDDSDYQSLETDNIPEVNIVNAKHFIPQNLNFNGLSIEEMNYKNNEAYKKQAVKRIDDNFPFNTKVGHISRPEKKCALKNMKIPFFSHDKAETTKENKNKKRKLFGFRKFKKQSSSIYKINEHISNGGAMKPTETSGIFNKINKRSYAEKLCPACRLKYLENMKPELDNEQQEISNNIIHNSRQYYQKPGYQPKVLEGDKPCNFETKPNSLENNVDFENSMKDRRWKRHDETVEEKQKKDLEEIEKKVDSVKVDTQDNKILEKFI